MSCDPSPPAFHPVCHYCLLHHPPIFSPSLTVHDSSAMSRYFERYSRSASRYIPVVFSRPLIKKPRDSSVDACGPTIGLLFVKISSLSSIAITSLAVENLGKFQTNISYILIFQFLTPRIVKLRGPSATLLSRIEFLSFCAYNFSANSEFLGLARIVTFAELYRSASLSAVKAARRHEIRKDLPL